MTLHALNDCKHNRQSKEHYTRAFVHMQLPNIHSVKKIENNDEIQMNDAINKQETARQMTCAPNPSSLVKKTSRVVGFKQNKK